MKRGSTFAWIPLWVDKWLWGSTRHELAHDERAIFIDLLTLAAKDDGYIRANQETGYPIEQLAGMLCAPVELLERTITQAIHYGKLEEPIPGIFHVSSWEGYQLSDRRKRDLVKEEEVISEKTAPTSEKTASLSSMYKSSLISFNSQGRVWEGITAEDMEGWAAAYPACDINGELRKAGEWIIANPTKTKSNYRRFIVNWLSRQQDRGGSGGAQSYAPYTKPEYKASQVGKPNGDMAEQIKRAHERNLKEHPELAGEEEKP